jgi:branched-chain amino acid transport system permease protein
VNYEQFQLKLSVQYLAMIVIGGLGSVRGSILGAVFITLLPIALRAAMVPLESTLPGGATQVLSSARLFLFGLVIVVCIVLEPGGLARVPGRVLSWWRTRLATAHSRGPGVANA